MQSFLPDRRHSELAVNKLGRLKKQTLEMSRQHRQCRDAPTESAHPHVLLKQLGIETLQHLVQELFGLTTCGAFDHLRPLSAPLRGLTKQTWPRPKPQ